jgi:hypothetical protein
MKIPDINVLVANLLGMYPASVAIIRGEDLTVPVFEHSEAAREAFNHREEPENEAECVRIYIGWIRTSLRDIYTATTIDEAKRAYEFAPDDTKREALRYWLEHCTTAAEVAECCHEIQCALETYELLELEAARKMAIFLEAELAVVTEHPEGSTITLADLPPEIQRVITVRADEVNAPEDEFVERMFHEKIIEGRHAMPMLRLTEGI